MVTGLNKLKLECIAIGSVPDRKLSSAMSVMQNCFKTIPYWPQMVKISKNEDMCFQFSEGVSSLFLYGRSQLEADYKAILAGDTKCLEKYSLSPDFACSFESFLNLIRRNKPEFAKGQITGPFTLGVHFLRQDRELTAKMLTLKALWQINKMKEACPTVTPVIFVDEPSLSRLGGFERERIISILKEISDVMKSAGAVTGFHCCAVCDWAIPIECGFDMISLDAYTYSEVLAEYSEEIETFLKSSGKIVWGIVPTLDKEALKNIDVRRLIEKFNLSVKYLTNKGIDEKLIIDNSLISPSCGTGRLPEELSQKVFELVRSLSDKLKKMYIINEVL